MTGTNDYSMWEALLAAKVSGVDPPPIDPNEPAVGFYRSRRKGQPYVPVAIWMDGGELCCQMNGEDIAAQKVIDSWPFISKNPVSHPQYEFYMANGRWEDADEVVHSQMADNPKAVIGDNEPPDELTLMKEQIDSASAGVSAYAEIADDVTQAKAQSLRSRLLELSTGADKKQPHLEGGKAVDKKWKPLVDAAKAAADTIRAAMAKWETKKSDKIRQEQAEAAKVAREAAAAAEKAGKPLTVVHVPPPPVAPPQPIRGGYGRAASARPVKVVKAIVDQDALYAYFKGYPEVVDCLLALAKKQVKMYPDSPPPGVEVKEEMDVR